MDSYEYAQEQRRLRQEDIADSNALNDKALSEADRERIHARSEARAMERERVFARFHIENRRPDVAGVVSPELAEAARVYNAALHATKQPADAYMATVESYRQRHPEASVDDAKLAVANLLDEARCLVPEILWAGVLD